MGGSARGKDPRIFTRLHLESDRLLGQSARIRPAHTVFTRSLASWARNQIQNTVMNSLPAPALVAALAAVIALPFSVAAAGTLLLTASLGFIIHADYAQRMKRIRLPRLTPKLRTSNTRTPFRDEAHPLAA